MKYPTESDLRARVAQLRKSSPHSDELANALLAYIETLWFEPDVSGPLIDEAIEISEATGSRLGKARCQIAKALELYIRTRYQEGLPLIAEALPVVVEHGADRDLSRAMLLLAATSQVSGAYDQALEYGYKALDVAQRSDNEETAAWMHYRIADIYRELGDREQMLEFAEGCHVLFEDLYKLSGRVQHRIGKARARTQLAIAHEQIGELDEALRHNEAALEQYRDADDPLGETRALTDIGRIHALRGNHKLGEQYQLNGLELRRKLGHRVSQTSNLIALGEMYLDQGDTDRAAGVLEEALSIAVDANVKMRQYQIHEALSRVFMARDNTEKAFTHFRAFHDLKEQAAGEAMSLKIHNRNVLAEIDRAEREAAIERAKSEELKEKNDELARLLAKLKATQDRLIQSEKMASLGQLTAGIAHEIRNPLNFVNNFSELSAELVAEMSEALTQCGSRLPKEQREQMHESLEMLVFNTSKIMEHGRRADGIVKSMLEHSRTGDGERTSVDLNKLLEEYLNLAYHGMRARETEFNVTLERDYDDAVGHVEVVPQDLGRVFLNLFSNAFEAMKGEGRKEEGGRSQAVSDRRPTVRISTLKLKSQPDGSASVVEIRILDNGPGIPTEVRDKIFEPFFTTKPTGSGTGLGLSMSYDIVTKGHGGSLDVEASEDGGAVFVIRLPV